MSFQTEQLLGADFSRVDDTAAFAVGTVAHGTDGGEWTYGKAGGAITGADYVAVLDAAWSATLASTTNSPFGLRICVAPGAMAQNQYGWFQTGGVRPGIRVNASCAANVKLNTTATGGQLDDDGTGGAKTASGIVLTTANGVAAGSAPGVIFNPVVGATL